MLLIEPKPLQWPFNEGLFIFDFDRRKVILTCVQLAITIEKDDRQEDASVAGELKTSQPEAIQNWPL